MTNEEILNVLNKWGEETVANCIVALGNKTATHDLANSIRYRFGDNFIEFLMEDYGQFVESGTKEHYISVSKYPGVAKQFVRWANAKGVESAIVDYYRTLDTTNSGYIKVKQQKPVKFFTSVIEESIQDLVPQLEESIIQAWVGRLGKAISTGNPGNVIIVSS